MPVALDQFHAFYGQRIPVGAISGLPANTEPLLCYCVAIFEAGVTNIARMHIRVFRQLIGNPARVGTDLLYPQPVMLAIAAELEIQQFGYDEIRWRRANTTGAQRFAERASPIRKRCQ